ncbi:MAG: diaminobutyrate acetyltransferase [Glaciimonas sp.]|nr:diaminobutyrate acetyltransferase [Glaciimonas sp.]
MNAPALAPAPTLDRQPTLRQPQQHDGAALHSLIAACPPLDLNAIYAYLLLCLHHAQTSVVAEIDGKLVGAITAYIPPEQPDTLFVWQVAVAPQQRGQGLGRRMLRHLLSGCIAPRGLRWMETTISPSNQASSRLFTHFALQHAAGCTTATLFVADDFGESGHEEERLYKIGPWDRVA